MNGRRLWLLGFAAMATSGLCVAEERSFVSTGLVSVQSYPPDLHRHPDEYAWLTAGVNYWAGNPFVHRAYVAFDDALGRAKELRLYGGPIHTPAGGRFEIPVEIRTPQGSYDQETITWQNQPAYGDVIASGLITGLEIPRPRLWQSFDVSSVPYSEHGYLIKIQDEQQKVGGVGIDRAELVTSIKTHVVSVGVNWDNGLRGGVNARNFSIAAGRNYDCLTNEVLVLDQHSANAKAAFFGTLDTALQQVVPGDRFILYISSHGGTLSSGENDERSVSAGDEMIKLSATDAIEDDQLSGWLTSNAPQGWSKVDKLFILQSCHSGGFWGGNDAGDLDRIPRSALLSSSGEDSMSQFDPSTGTSLFTNEIIAGLTSDRGTADTNRDGVVSAEELAAYAIAGVGTGQYRGSDLPIEDFLPEPGTVLPFQYAPEFHHTSDWEDFPVPVPEPSALTLVGVMALCLVLRFAVRQTLGCASHSTGKARRGKP